MRARLALALAVNLIASKFPTKRCRDVMRYRSSSSSRAAYSEAGLDVRAPTRIGIAEGWMRRATNTFRAAAVATASFATSRWVAWAQAEPSASTSASSSSAPTSGSNARDVTPLDAPIAAAYPTAANKSTAQWRVYTDIGRDLSARGRLDEAGRYLRRALAEAKAGFGEDDPHVAAARNNLAELYRLQRRWDEAEALYTQAAAALERHYGTGHPPPRPQRQSRRMQTRARTIEARMLPTPPPPKRKQLLWEKPIRTMPRRSSTWRRRSARAVTAHPR